MLLQGAIEELYTQPQIHVNPRITILLLPELNTKVPS